MPTTATKRTTGANGRKGRADAAVVRPTLLSDEEVGEMTQMEMQRYTGTLEAYLEAKYPEEIPLLTSLSNTYSAHLAKAEDDAVIFHGRQIMALLSGATFVPDTCADYPPHRDVQGKIDDMISGAGLSPLYPA